MSELTEHVKKDLDDMGETFHRQKKIGIDCSPGDPRPKDLIGGVVDGTGLVVTEHPTPMFGAATYFFDVDDEKWANEIWPVVKERLDHLYNIGKIRGHLLSNRYKS